jgi:ribonuclease VapC
MALYVFDASAVLAYLKNETGGETAKNLLKDGAIISAINWSEVLKVLKDNGHEPKDVTQDLQACNILGRILLVEPFDEQMAQEAASLSPLTKPYGLSLGDRACIAQGRLLQLPVVTADRKWKEIVPACVLIRS